MISYIVDVAACCCGTLYGIYIIILNSEIYCYSCLSILWYIGCIIKFLLYFKGFWNTVLSWLRSDLTGNSGYCSNFLSFNIFWIRYKLIIFYKELCFYGNFILSYIFLSYLFCFYMVDLYFSQTMWLTGIAEELWCNQFC